MLGYGIDEVHLTAKLEELSANRPALPMAMIVDSGSTDSGPEKLALGTMTCPEDSYVRDLTKLVRSSITYNVPVLVSSVGGDGSNAHLAVFVQMVKDIAVSLQWLVAAEPPTDFVLGANRLILLPTLVLGN
jgi:hypothetical protein